MKKDAEKAITRTERVASNLAELATRTDEAISQLLSANTRRAYLSTWGDFSAWCAQHSLASLPAEPETLCAYIASLAREGSKASSLDRALAAISTIHKLRGFESPRAASMVGIARKAWRRKLTTAKDQKAPILAAQLRAIVDASGSDLRGLRDRAIVLLAWHGALRRSELVGLDVSDLAFEDQGLTITLRRSKADQDGASVKVGIPYGSHRDTCPVRSVRAWLDASELPATGPAFVSLPGRGRVSRVRWPEQSERLDGQAVARLVQRLAARAGLDIPAGKVAAHSLRAGLVTQAARAGKPVQAILKQTRHRTLAVLLDYIRDADLYRDNAAAGLGT